MIAVDTNILVYAHRADVAWHPAAARCLSTVAEASTAWALPWPCLHEFFGVVTNPRIFSVPSPTESALAQIDAWLSSPSVVLLAESARHWQSLSGLLSTGRISGPKVHDARIAALCLQHGVKTLWSADRDFSRFPQLRTHNPLMG